MFGSNISLKESFDVADSSLIVQQYQPRELVNENPHCMQLLEKRTVTRDEDTI